MKVTDILTLATKGYTVEDIKTVNEIAKETPEVLELAKTGLKVNDLKDLVALADAGDTESDTKKQSPERSESEDTPDYKALYEETKKEVENLKTTVSKIQDDNAKRDNSGDKKEFDIIETLNNMITECN